MAAISPLAQQLNDLQAQIDELKSQRATYVLATVTSVSGNSFGASIPNPVDGSQVSAGSPGR